MRKEPFPIKNILDSLREDVQNGTITLSQAAEELHRAGCQTTSTRTPPGGF